MGRKVIGERQLETSSSWESQLWDCPTAKEKKERKKKETHQKTLISSATNKAKIFISLQHLFLGGVIEEGEGEVFE